MKTFTEICKETFWEYMKMLRWVVCAIGVFVVLSIFLFWILNSIGYFSDRTSLGIGVLLSGLFCIYGTLVISNILHYKATTNEKVNLTIKWQKSTIMMMYYGVSAILIFLSIRVGELLSAAYKNTFPVLGSILASIPVIVVIFIILAIRERYIKATVNLDKLDPIDVTQIPEERFKGGSGD